MKVQFQYISKKMLTILVLCLLLEKGLADILDVQLPDGAIRGREATTLTGKTFYAFQKVPFAAPPLGNLRFQAPVPPPAWEGVLNTTENNVFCYQMSGDTNGQSEDCLYLNVFTPELPTNESNPSYAVMFYIYGGGFIGGNCLINNCGPEYLLDHDVVIVTINYRIGPFGFLSTQDTTIPGNAGLKDQQLAIQWTHDNIHLFGGDPEKILIFGQSAGSASVTYQLLNKKNEGLFRAAIGESASYLCPWAFQRDARKLAFQTAGYINDTFNDSDDSEALLEFLQSVSAEDIHAASSQIQNQDSQEYSQIVQGFFYAPVVEPEHDGAFITENMYVTLQSGNVIKVPILMGLNSEESIIGASDGDLASFQNYMENLDAHLDWLVPNDMRIKDETAKAAMGKSIRDLLTGGQPLADNMPRGVRYLSDTSFNRGIIKFAQLQSKLSDVYFYQFSYDGELGNFNAAQFEGDGTVAHSEETRYVWRQYGGSYDNSDISKFPEADGVTQRRIQRIWTDFAKTLNPTPEKIDLLQNVTWPTVSENDFVYLDIGENLELKQHPKSDTFDGWVALYDSLDIEDFDTY